MAQQTVNSLSRETKGLGLAFIGVVIFGATLPMTRLGVGDLGPWFLTAGRAAGAGLVALIVLAATRRPLPDRARLIQLLLAALMLVGGFPAFSGLAMQSVPANHGGVVIGALPLATAITAALIDRERPSPAFWACGVAGTLVIIAFALRRGGGHVQAGDLLLAGAVISAALGYTISGKLTRDMPGWEVVSWQVVLTLPATLFFTYWFWPAQAGAVPARSWAALGYLALMSMYLGFFFWNAGLAMAGVARASQVQLLQSFVTLGVSAALLGEVIDTETLVFAGVIVSLVMLGRKTRITRA